MGVCMSQKLNSSLDKQMTINYPSQDNKLETPYSCDKFQGDSKIETNVFKKWQLPFTMTNFTVYIIHSSLKMIFF